MISTVQAAVIQFVLSAAGLATALGAFSGTAHQAIVAAVPALVSSAFTIAVAIENHGKS